MEQEILCYRERLQLPESEQSMTSAGLSTTGDAVQDAQLMALREENEDLRNRFDQAEDLCQDLMEENDVLKEEVEGLKREIDEMHDNFQVDHREKFYLLAKESLLNASGSCLNFRMRMPRLFAKCRKI